MTPASDRPLVSVVIPAYNRAHIVGRAIESALAQSWLPDEIVVVDDCSKDATRDVLADWQKRQPRVRPVFLANNSGPAGARNAGVEAARGELIAFLDSDDLWLPGHLAECVGLLQNDPGLDLVFSDLRRVHVSGRVVQSSFLTEHKRIGQYLAPHPGAPGWYRFRVPEVEVLFRDYVVPVQTTVIRAETAKAFRFDQSLRGPEDYRLMLQLARVGKRFGYVDRVLCEVFLHDANLVGEGTDARMCGEDIKLWGGVLRDPASKRWERLQSHRHLSRLWHDQGHSLLRRGERGQALRAYARSLWHRPSLRATKGFAKAITGLVTGGRSQKETL
ncbi:MAG: glycosyltransferase family 2 protein [Planctomycetia bacterium]|nr:glycosyltransferase family 2 protein [Planctomycetia bacterium]